MDGGKLLTAPQYDKNSIPKSSNEIIFLEEDTLLMDYVNVAQCRTENSTEHW